MKQIPKVSSFRRMGRRPSLIIPRGHLKGNGVFLLIESQVKNRRKIGSFED